MGMKLGCTERAVVSISGTTCSGKTTFAQELETALVGEGVTVTMVHLDSYFRDKDDPLVPKDADGRSIFDLPSSYHGGEFISAVSALSRGCCVDIPTFDLEKNKRRIGDNKLAMPARVIIAEGLFANTLLKDAKMFAICVFMDIPIETCLNRRIERDVAQFSVTPERVREIWRMKVLPYLNLQRGPEKDCATIIVTSTDKGE